jgi:hypothetical protein
MLLLLLLVGICSASYCNLQPSATPQWCDVFRTYNPASGCPYFFFADPTIPYTPNDGTLNFLPDGGVEITAYPFTVTPNVNNTILDHIKWYAPTTNPVVVNADESAVFQTALSCQTQNTANFPFPANYVTNANDDIRLATCGLFTIDLANFFVFDFFVTNEGLWAFYERLSFARTATNNYRAFSSAKRIRSRSSPDAVESLGIRYNRAQGKVQWLDGCNVVATVSNIGTPAPDFVLVSDFGGTDQVVDIANINFGIGTFTLLDMSDPLNPTDKKAPVNLLSAYGGYVIPNSFHDNGSPLPQIGNKLWGQGAKLTSYVLKGWTTTRNNTCAPFF